MKAGVKRRENNDEYIALTLAPDAQELLDTVTNGAKVIHPNG